MKALLAGALGLLLLASGAHAGTLLFTLQGVNPDGKSGYRGTVALTEVSNGVNGEKAGVVTWRVDRSSPVRGIALTTSDSPGRISISFPNTPIPGVALGSVMNDGSVRVVWYVGGKAAGTEVWSPRK